MSRILVIGSANMDLVVTADRIPLPGETLLGGDLTTHPGGKGANQAVAAARCGGEAAMLGCVGDDAFGEQLRAALSRAGVDVAALATAKAPSGVALIVVTPTGENSIVVAPGANGRLSASEIPEAAFAGAAVVLAQLETPIDGVIRAAQIARANGAVFILDPAPARPLPDALLALVDWLTPNETEAAALLGWREPFEAEDAALALQRRGPRGVVVKLGKRGAVLLPPGGPPRSVPPFPVEAVDTTAAGDAFNGAFAVGLAEGAAPEQAARFASAAAALSVTRPGAQPSMAMRAEIEELLRL